MRTPTEIIHQELVELQRQKAAIDGKIKGLEMYFGVHGDVATKNGLIGKFAGYATSNEMEKVRTKKHAPRFATKSCCGSTGAWHFKTCKGIQQHVDNSEEFGPGQYEKIRVAMHDKEFQSARYALINKLSPREVNFAVRSKDYGEYRELRTM